MMAIPLSALPLLLLTLGLAMPSTVPAQQPASKPLYRIVGPDGQVTFTDRPPTAAPAAVVAVPLPPSAPPTATLPADLAAVVQRFPVTFYRGADCPAACTEARALLEQRGVPHVVRTVTTPRDTAELQRLTGAALLPSLTVGRQPLPGWRRADWSGFLDAAGYPEKSRLPAGYRMPDAAPLAPPPAVAAASAPQAPPPPTPSGPGGIRF